MGIFLVRNNANEKTQRCIRFWFLLWKGKRRVTLGALTNERTVDLLEGQDLQCLKLELLRLCKSL
ncbi:hypothetical protein HanIR_Chr15g0730421 [Helianthus annuus]|nr:hypothetical protein HanIR_Chr15g0730421 [Helianthus annuus]